MKKWHFELEVVENDDDFFTKLNPATQHSVLKNFVLDCLTANGFDTRIKILSYSEVFEEEFQGPAALPAVVEDVEDEEK